MRVYGKMGRPETVVPFRDFAHTDTYGETTVKRGLTNKILKIFLFTAFILLCTSVFTACGRDGGQLEHEHAWNDWTVSAPATCTEDGTKTRRCILCDAVETDTVKAAGHGWGVWTWDNDSPADCLLPGVKRRTCAKCAATEKQDVPSLGHDIKRFKAQAATCTEAGFEAYEICLKCDYTTYVKIPPTGHSFARSWTYDSEKHWRAAVCAHTEEKSEETPHVWRDGVCSVCTYRAEYTIGLSFTLSADRSHYSVSAGAATGNIVIPAEYNGLPVTAIDERGFVGSSLIGIVMGRNISVIGANAFDGCAGLKSVTFGGGETVIGMYAFYKCTGLTEIDFPDSVIRIERAALRGCDNVSKLTVPFVGAARNDTPDTHFGYIFGATDSRYHSAYVPDSLNTVCITDAENIAASAFANCVRIQNIVLPDGIKTIAETAFDNTGIIGAVIPAQACKYMPDSLQSVTVTCGIIMNDSFRGRENLTSVDIEDNVSAIGYYVFYDCTGLKKVTVGNGVTNIGASAFENCVNLTDITLGDSVKYILERAFYGCGSLTSVTIPSGVTGMLSGSLFKDCASLKNIEISGAVTSLGTGIFSGCASLKTVEIPDSVTMIGSNAFSDCISLTQIRIPDKVTMLSTGIFLGCTSLRNIELHDGITSIGASAFSGCTAITEFVVSDKITSIGRGAFAGCGNLVSLTVPFVGSRAGANETDYNQHPLGWIFGTVMTEGCTATEQYYYGSAGDITKTVYYIPDSLKNVVVTGGKVLYGAFYGCSRLESVTVGASVGRIQPNAFYKCDSLKSAYFEVIAGWKVVSAETLTEQVVDVSDPAVNATCLTGVYTAYTWINA